jgi:hypothetical protein
MKDTKSGERWEKLGNGPRLRVGGRGGQGKAGGTVAVVTLEPAVPPTHNTHNTKNTHTTHTQAQHNKVPAAAHPPVKLGPTGQGDVVNNSLDVCLGHKPQVIHARWSEDSSDLEASKKGVNGECNVCERANLAWWGHQTPNKLSVRAVCW